MNYEVGKKVWRVGYDFKRNEKDGKYVDVVKVGRTIAEIKNGGWTEYVVMETGTTYQDKRREFSTGRVYESEEAHTEEKCAREAWTAFQSRVQHMYNRPAGVTVEDIANVRGLLRMDAK